MKTYKRFSALSHPVYASLDAQGCWLEYNPIPRVTESTSFRAIPFSGRLSERRTRSYELGQSDQYYSCICRGIGNDDLINLYSSEQQARQHYDAIVNRCEGTNRWDRVTAL
jgi:hypothetical protein